MTSTQIKLEIINYKNKVETKNGSKIDLKTFQGMLFGNIPAVTKFTSPDFYQKSIFDKIISKIEKSNNSTISTTKLTLTNLKDNIEEILSKKL